MFYLFLLSFLGVLMIENTFSFGNIITTKYERNWARWLKCVIPATWGSEVWKMAV
jgi:hypothetical protein